VVGPLLPIPVAWALGAVALVLGIIALRRVRREPAVGRRGMSIWGVVLGVAALGLGTWGAVIVADVGEDLENLGEPEETKTASLGETLELETQDTAVEVTPTELGPVEVGRFDSSNLVGIDLEITNTGDAAFDDSLDNDVQLLASGGERVDSAYFSGGPCESTQLRFGARQQLLRVRCLRGAKR
jgi:hypothetical protein